jgi:dipeptidyl aminopeptidase/acylaminoacyl peptidase
MKKIQSVMILAAMVAIMVSCTQTPVEVTRYTIEQFYDNLSIGGGSFSSDETRLLVSSNQTGIYNVFSLNVDGSGEEQLTFSEEESYFATSYFPEDDRFLYSADKGGDENSHLYMQEPDGTVTDLTPWEGSTSQFAGWSRDFKYFYLVSNKRDPRFFDMYKMDLENFEPLMIYENTENLTPSAISNTGRYVALTQDLTTSNNEMYLLDLSSGEIKHISEHEGDATYSPADFSLDDQLLYYLSNEGGEFTYLSSYNLETGEKELVYEADWDVSYAYFSFNAKYKVIGINEDAKTVVKVFDTATGEEVSMPDFGNRDIAGVSISRSETQIRLAAGSPTSPSDMYMHQFGEEGFTRLTHSLNKEINEADLVAGEVIRYPSYDGLEIPAILYKPLEATEKNKVPALLMIHGGPGGQSRLGFNSRTQYLVNHGYAVLAVNNRGSSGYGKTFYNLDNQRHGEDDLMDCVQAKDYLAGLGYIDMDKVGIMGGSYGGYMVMAALTYQPDAFAVGVNLFGVTNWLRTLKSIPPYWEAFRKALYDELGDPFTEDSVRLYEISPLFHAQNVSKPLMVLQGANDPRVLQVESDEIVAAVKENGVPVEYVIFDDEGHGFVKKENQIKGYGQILEFLDKYLKGVEQE